MIHGSTSAAAPRQNRVEFDVLRLGGEDVRLKPQRQRRELLERFDFRQPRPPLPRRFGPGLSGEHERLVESEG